MVTFPGRICIVKIRLSKLKKSIEADGSPSVRFKSFEAEKENALHGT